MKKYGLIGYPLGHSYSKDFFQKKFKELGLADHSYELFEMEFLKEFPALWLKHSDLQGINVTVPHKEKVTKFLDKLDLSSIKVGATNVVVKRGGKLIGYNTDYLAFKESLQNWIGKFKGEALILGTGGASKAVQASLSDLNIDFNQVSRQKTKGDYTYDQLKLQPEIIDRFRLIINTTPLGTYPNDETYPDIPYERLTKTHFLYDLVYNPTETSFMKRSMAQGSKTKNGLEMLKLQAEKSWSIWSNG
jgi:shikimate dehydrogenase